MVKLKKKIVFHPPSLFLDIFSSSCSSSIYKAEPKCIRLQRRCHGNRIRRCRQFQSFKLDYKMYLRKSELQLECKTRVEGFGRVNELGLARAGGGWWTSWKTGVSKGVEGYLKGGGVFEGLRGCLKGWGGGIWKGEEGRWRMRRIGTSHRVEKPSK